jgi:hypothetical protein
MLAARVASFRDRSKMDIVSIFCLSAFLRKQSFEAAILVGAKKSEIPERGDPRREHYSPNAPEVSLVRGMNNV